jgi:predicted kinase/predicted phosphohydrolase
MDKGITMKIWHISDVHLSFDKDWNILKPMDMRRWSIGSWTYVGYLDKMTHDMRQDAMYPIMSWLRHHINGTLIIIRGNHDVRWDVAKVRQMISAMTDIYLIDEGEMLTLGDYAFGCFSNHKEKTLEFSNMASDGRYLEMAFNLVRFASDKNKIPVMLSHYPANPQLAQAIGKAGVKAYLSGHVHCTAANEPGNINGVHWVWYDKSAALTDDKTIEGCFFSTGTTDVLLAKHGVSFKHIHALGIVDTKSAVGSATDKFTTPAEMIVLCGIPGSGKSTIAKIFEGKEYARINQDELGNRKACMRTAEAALSKGLSVVIDRCNFNESQRATWVSMARRFKVDKIKAVVLNCDPAVALERATARTDHPTIKSAESASVAVSAISGQWDYPALKEGFHEIIDVPASSTVEETLQLLLGDLKHG